MIIQLNTRAPIEGRVTWALMALAAIMTAAPARADDSWNPFRDRDQARAERRAKTIEPERAPPLAPMRGGDADADGGIPRTDGSVRAGVPDGNLPRPAATDPGGDRPEQPALAATSDAVKRLPPPDERSRAVDRSELPPVAIADGTDLPGDIWQGIDARRVEAHIAKLELPVQSTALAGLWRRIVLAPGAPSGADPRDFEAFRLDRLLRTGLIDDATAAVGKDDGAATAVGLPLNQLFRAKTAFALGISERACAWQTALNKQRAELPQPVRAEVLLLAGYCAAIAGNRAATGLSAELAREDGATNALALAALDAFAAEARPAIQPPKVVTLSDYRFLQLGAGVDPRAIAAQADAALLIALARDPSIDGSVRVFSAERAARFNALQASELAEIYLATGRSDQGAAAAQPAPHSQGPAQQQSQAFDSALRRATLFRAADAEKTPLKRARAIRSLLDDARRAGLYPQMLKAVAGLVRDMRIIPEYGWFAETAVEVLLADEKFDDARRIVEIADRFDRPAGGDGLRHWLALIDVADPRMVGRRGEMLPSVEQLAVRGRLSGDQLHRLATVLDALDYNVPVALWDAANRAPPPTKGFLPDTGILAELHDASKKKELGRTMLLSLRTLGRDGPEGAQMIGLGDTIRALRRVGLEQDARRMALEALFAGWPRTTQ